MKPVIIEQTVIDDIRYAKVLTEDNRLVFRAASYYHLPHEETVQPNMSLIDFINSYKPQIDKNIQ